MSKMRNLAIALWVLGLVFFIGIFSAEAESISAANASQLSLSRTILAHVEGVNPIAFSPNAEVLATGSYDKTVKLWRVSDGTPLRTLQGHSATIYGVAFSPDGQVLASASDDKTARLWRVSDGTLLNTLSHADTVRSVAFSPDGQILATASFDKTIKIWKTSDGSLLRILKGHANGVYFVTFSPDGQTLASAAKDNKVKIWQVIDGSLLKTIDAHTNYARAVAFSPDGQTLASTSYDNTVKLWRVSDWSPLRTLEGHSGAVYSAAFSPDGQILASSSLDLSTIIWRVNTGEKIHTLSEHSREVYSVAFSPDGQLLATASHDGNVNIWSISSVPTTDQPSDGKPIKQWSKSLPSGWAFQKTNDDGLIVTGKSDQGLYLSRLDSSGTMLWQKNLAPGSFGTSVKQTADGGYVVAGDTTTSVGNGVYLARIDSSGNPLWQQAHVLSHAGKTTTSIEYNSATDYFNTNFNPDATEKDFASVGNAVLPSTDGGFILVGRDYMKPRGNGTPVYSNLLVLKTDADGNRQWCQTYEGMYSDAGWDIAASEDGGYVIAGDKDVSPGLNQSLVNVWLLKIDAAGKKLWEKTFGQERDSYANALKSTRDGGYIIVGTITLANHDREVYLIKTDGSGNQQWEKVLGGRDLDTGAFVQETADGGYLVSGKSDSFGNTETDIYLFKTSSSGNLEWQYNSGRPGNDAGDFVYICSNGACLVGGGSGNSFYCEKLLLPNSTNNGDNPGDDTGSGTTEELPSQPNQLPSKDWTIRFNQLVDQSTVSENTVYVMNSQNQKVLVNVTPGNDGKSVLVIHPAEGYPAGAYTLYVRPGVKSCAGKPLTKTYKMQFTVAAEQPAAVRVSSINADPSQIGRVIFTTAADTSLESVRAGIKISGQILSWQQNGPRTFVGTITGAVRGQAYTFTINSNFTLAAGVNPLVQWEQQNLPFTLSTTAFTNGAAIPLRYAIGYAGGQNVSPSLSWQNAPAGTKSFALLVYDPDGGNWVHWAVSRIPPATTSLSEGASLTCMPAGCQEYINDFTARGYGGPGPPPGELHRYKFILYALNTSNPVISSQPSYAAFTAALAGKIINQVEITGMFQR